MTEKSRITIVGVEASNFRRLTVAELRRIPQTGLVRVTGPNGAGKTSVLRAVAGALGDELDLDTVDALAKHAEEHGYQVWLARIGLEGHGEVVVTDGRAMDWIPGEETVG